MDAEELSLIREALRGDEAAFEAVIRAYSRRVYALAFGICQDASEAEDIAQDTFLKAWRYRRRLRDPAKFPAWLFATARHRALDLLRRRRSAPLPEGETERPDDSQAQPGAHLEEAELRQTLRTALASLAERHRTAVTLRYLEGLDTRSIESTMGLSSGALRGILGRALASLRKTLGPSASTLEP